MGSGHLPPDVQDEVDRYFDSVSGYWGDVYAEAGLQGEIYRRRQARVLALIDAAGSASGSRVLEVGSGGGRLTVELVRRGLNVHATDSSSSMVERTAARVASDALAGQATSAVADVHALDLSDGEFDYVVAIGVLPWLHSPAAGVAEMARVLAPGGRLVLTTDSRARLGLWLDPRLNPALARVRERLKVALGRGSRSAPGLGDGGSRLALPRDTDALLAAAGLEKLSGATVGFGPFSFLGVSMPDLLGSWLDRLLQQLADRGVPGLRTTGWHYLVAARKARDPAPNALSDAHDVKYDPAPDESSCAAEPTRKAASVADAHEK